MLQLSCKRLRLVFLKMRLRVIALHNVRAIDLLRLYGQATKRKRRMPRRQEAMKDVVACEKPRGVGKLALIRGCPNGETHCFGSIHA